MKYCRIALFSFIVGSLLLYSFKEKERPGKLVNTYYKYVGPQLPNDRQDPSNYIKDAFGCTESGVGYECGVLLNQDFGDHPTFSIGDITFNNTTGMPDGGNIFVANYQKSDD